MNEYTIESFISYCDDMMIVEESELPTNIVNILIKNKLFSNKKDDLNWKKIDSYMSDSVYSDKWSGFSNKDIDNIFTERLKASNEFPLPNPCNLSDKHIISMGLLPLGGIGNGDFVLYSTKDKKIYYYKHDGSTTLRLIYKSFDEFLRNIDML